MTKARITIDLDLGDYPQAMSEEAVARLVNDLLLSPARAVALRGLQGARSAQDMDETARSQDMAAWLQRIKLTLCAEANISVELLQPDAPVGTTLPFEQRYNG